LQRVRDRHEGFVDASDQWYQSDDFETGHCPVLCPSWLSPARYARVLAHLLDGLHEDLNRICKAPYVVVTDGKHEWLVSARSDAHQRRNNSPSRDNTSFMDNSRVRVPSATVRRSHSIIFNHKELKSRKSRMPLWPFRSWCFERQHGRPAKTIRYGLELRSE
jgi:hypothetical protein